MNSPPQGGLCAAETLEGEQQCLELSQVCVSGQLANSQTLWVRTEECKDCKILTPLFPEALEKFPAEGLSAGHRESVSTAQFKQPLWLVLQLKCFPSSRSYSESHQICKPLPVF